MAKGKHSLPAAVAEKFILLTGAGAGEYYFKGHRVDLRTTTPEQAADLVANGFPYLVAKPVKEPENFVTP